MITDNKLCENCSKTIRGRSDKRFCNDYCRNVFNNNLNAAANNLVRRINMLLCKNRRILEALFTGKEKMIRIKKEILIQRGYSFKYATGIYPTKREAFFFYCYDYSILRISEDFYVIIKDCPV